MMFTLQSIQSKFSSFSHMRVYMIGSLFCLFCMLATGASAQTRKNNLSVTNGKGTYYLPREGKNTASGEPYYRNRYTCAHRTLPFGTRLRVTNQKNNRSVVVKVTDRGPFGKGYVVDLSYIAADAVKMIHSGVVPVRLEVVSDDTPLGPVAQAEPTTSEASPSVG